MTQHGGLILLCSKASMNARLAICDVVLGVVDLQYHASLLYDDVAWGPDEMTKEAAEVEWSRILQLMNPRTRGQPYASSQILSHKRRRFGD